MPATIWDVDISGPGTETNWDGATSTIWDELPEFIGRYVRVVWQSMARRVTWKSIGRRVVWRSYRS